MKLLDWAERAFLIGLYLVFAAELLRSPAPVNLLLLACETLAAVFVLIRRPALSVTRDPVAWAVALTATLLPLLLRPGGAPLVSWPATALALGGLILVVGAKFSLNRRLGMAPANRGVQASGAYAIVRHPMYLGYLTAQAGFLLSSPSWRNAILLALCWTLQLVRIQQEEAHLGTDPAYVHYASRVRFRLIPGVY